MAIESALSVNRSLRSLNVKQSQIPKEGFVAIGQATASNAGCRWGVGRGVVVLGGSGGW